jgi:lysophospholipase L1-like esterase
VLRQDEIVSEITVATVGDSITAGTPLWDPDPAVRATKPSVDERSQWQYWAQRRDPRLRFANHGVNRQETGEIEARLAAASAGFDVVVVQGGINDLVHGKTVADAAAGIESMVKLAIQLVPNVLVAELIPNNNFELDGDIRAVNARIGEVALAHHISVLPFYSTLEGKHTPGRMPAELTDDGNHPSVEGHRRLGEEAFYLPVYLRTRNQAPAE